MAKISNFHPAVTSPRNFLWIGKVYGKRFNDYSKRVQCAVIFDRSSSSVNRCFFCLFVVFFGVFFGVVLCVFVVVLGVFVVVLFLWVVFFRIY